MKKSKTDCTELRTKYDRLKKKYKDLKDDYYDLTKKYNVIKSDNNNLQKKYTNIQCSSNIPYSNSNRLEIIPNDCTRIIPDPVIVSPRIIYGSLYLTKKVKIGTSIREYHLFDSSNYPQFLFMHVETFDSNGIRRDEMYVYRMRIYGLTDDMIRGTPDIVALFNDGILRSC